MEKLLSIIEAQRELLNFIGYDIDIKKSNLYYLDKDGYLIGNIVKNPRYSREKEKNMHTMCHICIKDGKNKFDCYNGIKNKHSDRNILDRCAVLLNDDYILVKTFKEQTQDFSINYDNDKIIINAIFIILPTRVLCIASFALSSACITDTKGV